jgi:hypothetical protein
MEKFRQLGWRPPNHKPKTKRSLHMRRVSDYVFSGCEHIGVNAHQYLLLARPKFSGGPGSSPKAVGIPSKEINPATDRAGTSGGRNQKASIRSWCIDVPSMQHSSAESTRGLAGEDECWGDSGRVIPLHCIVRRPWGS